MARVINSLNTMAPPSLLRRAPLILRPPIVCCKQFSNVPRLQTQFEYYGRHDAISLAPQLCARKSSFVYCGYIESKFRRHRDERTV